LQNHVGAGLSDPPFTRVCSSNFARTQKKRDLRALNFAHSNFLVLLRTAPCPTRWAGHFPPAFFQFYPPHPTRFHSSASSLRQCKGAARPPRHLQLSRTEESPETAIHRTSLRLVIAHCAVFLLPQPELSPWGPRAWQ